MRNALSLSAAALALLYASPASSEPKAHWCHNGSVPNRSFGPDISSVRILPINHLRRNDAIGLLETKSAVALSARQLSFLSTRTRLDSNIIPRGWKAYLIRSGRFLPSDGSRDVLEDNGVWLRVFQWDRKSRKLSVTVFQTLERPRRLIDEPLLIVTPVDVRTAQAFCDVYG